MSYDPVGRCIYCRATIYSAGEPDHPLGEEHIVPRSLGGTLVLPEASCKKCERITGALETKCVRALFDPGRAHLGIKGKKGRKFRSRLPVKIGREGRMTHLAVHDHPGVLMMFRFSMPAALLCLNPTETASGNIVVAPAVSNFNERIRRTAGGLNLVIGGGISAETFARMLAKIAHAYAVAELGVDGFTHVLPPLVVGEPPYYVSRYVGSGVIDEPKSKERHELRITYAEDLRGTKLIQVRIRLFADFALPAHYIVAGTPL